MAITVKDIAKMAGVSHTTVLKALYDKPKIGAETKERILKIARENNYTLNANASNLALKTNDSIGLVITDSSIPLLAQLTKVIEREANKKGYKIIVSCSNGDPKREIEAIEQLHRLRVAGLIVAPTYRSGEFIKYLNATDIPFLVLGRIDDFDIDYITFNDFSAAYQATSYLISCGHRRIACATSAGDTSIQTYPFRYWIEGYQAALREASLCFDPELLLPCDNTQESGYELGKAFHKMVPSATALISFADQNIAGILRGLYESGMKVPSDVSLICLQDESSLAYYMPAVTAVSYPNQDLASMAAEYLLQKLSVQKQNSHREKKLLDTTLILRESVKKQSE